MIKTILIMCGAVVACIVVAITIVTTTSEHITGNSIPLSIEHGIRNESYIVTDSVGKKHSVTLRILSIPLP